MRFVASTAFFHAASVGAETGGKFARPVGCHFFPLSRRRAASSHTAMCSTSSQMLWTFGIGWPQPWPPRRLPGVQAARDRAMPRLQRRGGVDLRCPRASDNFRAFSLMTVYFSSAAIAIPAPFAASIIFCPSSRRHFPASTARQLAPAACMTSMVFTPITGTSKRIS